MLTLWYCGPQLSFFLYFAVAAILIVLSLIDWDTMTIPNGLLIALCVPAVCSVFLLPPSLLSRLIGVFVISLPMLLLTLLIPGCFGGGDIKLMAVCGFLLGWQNTLLAGFLGVVFGGVYGIVLLCHDRQNRNKQFPFGPFLSVGVWIALLWGGDLLRWYLNFCGLS